MLKLLVSNTRKGSLTKKSCNKSRFYRLTTLSSNFAKSSTCSLL